MEGTGLLIWGTVFGIIGLGFFVYGKKQKADVLLVILPYFVRI